MKINQSKLNLILLASFLMNCGIPPHRQTPTALIDNNKGSIELGYSHNFGTYNFKSEIDTSIAIRNGFSNYYKFGFKEKHEFGATLTTGPGIFYKYAIFNKGSNNLSLSVYGIGGSWQPDAFIKWEDFIWTWVGDTHLIYTRKLLNQNLYVSTGIGFTGYNWTYNYQPTSVKHGGTAEYPYLEELEFENRQFSIPLTLSGNFKNIEFLIGTELPIPYDRNGFKRIITGIDSLRNDITEETYSDAEIKNDISINFAIKYKIDFNKKKSEKE